MARNKYPEETQRKILEVAQKLFAEKGYEHTTIQDIVNGLGMSKGAVYHHFKSKEDIYDRISSVYYDKLDWFRDLNQLPGGTALEKMRYLFRFLLSDPEKLNLDRMGGGNTISISNNPKMVWLVLDSTIREAAPVVERLIHEGNADGSLCVAQPKETAEAFMLLMNVWVGIFIGDKNDFLSKMSFLQTMTDALGLPIIDNDVLRVALDYYDSVMANFKLLPR